jgi:hypothetical protein
MLQIMRHCFERFCHLVFSLGLVFSDMFKFCEWTSVVAVVFANACLMAIVTRLALL